MREFLLWCIPALLIGTILRALLLAQLPYGIYHADSGDLLTTPSYLFDHHRWVIHGKKTFLLPTAYTALAYLKLPILRAVPVIQHFLGLLLIVLTALLCRLWFVRWRWFILPITLIIAIDPALLWYEHLLMAESAYVFFLTTVAVAGTLYTLRPSRCNLALLCASLFLLAASRPEGKLVFGFAILNLLLLHLLRGEKHWLHLAILLVLLAITQLATRTEQAGLLLFTSVARLCPTDLRSAPGFDPYLAPIRADLQRRWETERTFPKSADRRVIDAAVESYLSSRGPESKPRGNQDINAFCLKMALETCRRRLLQLPRHFYEKFRYATHEPTHGYFDHEWVFERQQGAFIAKLPVMLPISREITGRRIQDEDAYIAFLHSHYRELPWFNQFADFWNAAIDAIRLPGTRLKGDTGYFIRPGVPIFFLIGTAGLILIMFRRGILQPFHLSWGLTLIALFYIVILTANVRGRFRFGWEPFWYLYIAALIDSLALWVFSKYLPDQSPSNHASARPT